MSENPTEADILKLVHEVKPKFNSKKAREMLGPKQNREMQEDQVGQLPQLMGQMPQGIPEEVREGIKFAEAKMRKLKLMD